MSGVFDGKSPGGPGGPPNKQVQTTTKGSIIGAGKDTHSIEFDNETGEMQVLLAPHLSQYRDELFRDLYENFYLATPNDDQVRTMSQFIDDWLKNKQAES
jgi:hypothetical protein